MVIDMDSTTDNIVSFRPIDRTLRDRKLDYVEPYLASACLTKNPLSLDSVNTLILTKFLKKDQSPAPSTIPNY